MGKRPTEIVNGVVHIESSPGTREVTIEKKVIRTTLNISRSVVEKLIYDYLNNSGAIFDCEYFDLDGNINYDDTFSFTLEKFVTDDADRIIAE
ncbi:hypothetical protein P9VFCI_057 [Rhizobium phage P9VFCI]|uniref:Uncharacterized protein n=2 Tax=Innesvirus TaxID=3044739 RepID=A0A7G7WXK4_9CAUD|nr:hypothetical protein PP937_gp057 [Rhizobium phage P9VFCI]YP_010662157.1 hypothetical protein PP938_gp007 [Rhizobium phage AF3]QNH71528.1 hypothetical protein AF3_007 [Rhizobium phage AF3]QNH71948.1 hypothetical protein P9VFCI_057 [Rhizobium phage P9VFCI]